MSEILKGMDTLYYRAVEKLASMKLDEDISKLSTEDIEKLIKDLRLHEIELDMQNWELLKVSNEIKESRDYYLNFYENAAVAYVRMDKVGLIKTVNTKFSNFIQIEKVDIEKANIYSFIQNKTESDKLYIHINSLFDSKTDQVFNLSFKSPDGQLIDFLTTMILDDESKGEEENIILCLMKNFVPAPLP